ncbi:MAG: hypothetical protein E7362_04400 [Clostridiales bacterium]|nr:hypothetical protein [Clostridiales bacterium]
MDYSNRINTVIETALKHLSGLADANTVVCSPIQYENGDFVIPVTSVTLGYLSGGGEYGKVSVFKKGKDLPFSAGNGAIVSLKPCAFLIKTAQNDYKILSVSTQPIEKLIDKIGDFLDKSTKEN